MTRDEMRAVCFLAMARARYKKRYGEDWNEAAFWLQVPHIADMTAAFDALHGIARLCPIEATEEMAAAGVHHRDNTQGGLAETFNVMAVVGDLTNAPGG